jgi:hypothetical protein
MTAGSMRIATKHGFGMSPPKPADVAKRHTAVSSVLALVEGRPGAALLDEVSEVKGLFGRAYKQDQWDWFLVWELLGRPGRKQIGRCRGALTNLRAALVKANPEEIAAAVSAFREAGGHVALSLYLQGGRPVAPGGGYIYIMSTREERQRLKIGFTTRTLAERAREISDGTGVLVPLGVRAAWAVDDARGAEKDIHALLKVYRVRPDREFFDLDYRAAVSIINDYVHERRTASASTV